MRSSLHYLYRNFVRAAHLALVDGNGPGQFEWQLLSTQVGPAPGFKHPAFKLQHFGDATQEAHAWESCRHWGGGEKKKKAWISSFSNEQFHTVIWRMYLKCSFRWPKNPYIHSSIWNDQIKGRSRIFQAHLSFSISDSIQHHAVF